MAQGQEHTKLESVGLLAYAVVLLSEIQVALVHFSNVLSWTVCSYAIFLQSMCRGKKVTVL